MTNIRIITLWPRFLKWRWWLALISLLSFTLSACSPAQNLVGTWEAQSLGIFNYTPVGRTLHFKDDGVLVTDQSSSDLHYKVIAPGKMLIVEGAQELNVSFTLEGDSLMLSIDGNTFVFNRVPDRSNNQNQSNLLVVETEPELSKKVIVATLEPPTPTMDMPVLATPTSTNVSDLPNHTQDLPDTQDNTTPIEVYRPLADCGLSRLQIGASAYVSLGGTKSSLRSTPDTHSSTNIIRKYLPGSVVEILDGPYCSYGILLWKVSTTLDETGYMAESDSDEFWMEPIESYLACPGSLPTRMQIGAQGFVEEMPKLRNIMRSEPESNSPEVFRIEPGRSFDVLDGPVCRDGQIWYQIRAHSNGRVGWTRESGDGRYFLAPLFR